MFGDIVAINVFEGARRISAAVGVKQIIYAATAFAILAASPAFSQMVIQAEMAKLQPQINRDEGGYKACGVRVVVVTQGEANFIDSYDFSMNIWASLPTALLKAGKSRTTKEKLLQGKATIESVTPAPVKFWISKESEGKALMPQNVTPAESKGYILEGADMAQTMDIIMATITGERMQFAIRYKDEPVDVVISFSENMADRERLPLMACFKGLMQRMQDRP
jgi:hypothetical protein